MPTIRTKRGVFFVEENPNPLADTLDIASLLHARTPSPQGMPPQQTGPNRSATVRSTAPGEKVAAVAKVG